MYAVEMASCDMMHIPSFMNIAKVVQALLKFFLRILRAVILVLWVMPLIWLRCHDIHDKFQEDWFRHSKVVIGGYAYRHT
jgi:hypothetical protein